MEAPHFLFGLTAIFILRGCFSGEPAGCSPLRRRDDTRHDDSRPRLFFFECPDIN